MNDLLEKRERQARRLLRVCLRPISTECIQRYVDGYEAGRLAREDPHLCAIGTMSSGSGGYCEWRDPDHPHHRESQHIENIFEGRSLFFKGWMAHCDPLRWRSGRWSERSTDHHRRRWIYEACLEALALRASEHTPRSPSAIPVED